MRLGSLCTGYGGLDLAVEALLPTETVWLSEIDKKAGQICDARFPGVPNLGDLTVIDWSEVEPVDVLTAGYPCQPFSHAGKRQGTNDVRHIWPFILDALSVLRPRLAVFENVAGHLSLGFDRVLADLASIGFDAEWCVVRASDVGACHQRKRIFITATDAHGGRLVQRDHGQRRVPVADEVRADAADADGSGLERRRRAELHRADECPAGPNGVPSPANAEGTARRGPQQQAVRAAAGSTTEPGERLSPSAWGDYWPAIARHAELVGRHAPAPTEDGRLSPAFVEWMMCLPAGWVTDVLPRNPALKALGNGVVPPQAAYAISHLLERHQAQEEAA